MSFSSSSREEWNSPSLLMSYEWQEKSLNLCFTDVFLVLLLFSDSLCFLIHCVFGLLWRLFYNKKNLFCCCVFTFFFFAVVLSDSLLCWAFSSLHFLFFCCCCCFGIYWLLLHFCFCCYLFWFSVVFFVCIYWLTVVFFFFAVVFLGLLMWSGTLRPGCLTMGEQLTPDGSTMWLWWASWLWLWLWFWLSGDAIFLWLGGEPACIRAILESTASQPSNPACHKHTNKHTRLWRSGDKTFHHVFFFLLTTTEDWFSAQAELIST